MANTQKVQESISDEKVQDFFSQANASNGCPICSMNRWHRLMEPLHGYNYAVPPMVPQYGPSGLEVVVLYCMNCGFVRQHSAHLIRAWSESNG